MFPTLTVSDWPGRLFPEGGVWFVSCPSPDRQVCRCRSWPSPSRPSPCTTSRCPARRRCSSVGGDTEMLPEIYDFLGRNFPGSSVNQVDIWDPEEKRENSLKNIILSHEEDWWGLPPLTLEMSDSGHLLSFLSHSHGSLICIEKKIMGKFLDNKETRKATIIRSMMVRAPGNFLSK